MESLGEFDFVVVGAGTAGCVAAARLSEGGSFRVALLEAGRDERGLWTRAPLAEALIPDRPASDRFLWRYDSLPEAELGGARLAQYRGRLIGGTGAVGGTVYSRGRREDFDYWRQLGNIGWGYDDVLPYFRLAEDNERGADEFHGVGGPLPVRNGPRHPLADAFVEAAAQAGFARNADFNAASDEGFGYPQLTIRSGRRIATADGYLAAARSRPNLAVVEGAPATRVLVDNGRAVGVEFTSRAGPRRVMARCAVVLSLGTFNTPQLLQLSGIGPAALLKSVGIAAIRDLPGVGRNLQDHVGPAMVYRSGQAVTVNDLRRNPLRRAAMHLAYRFFARGAMTTGPIIAAGCIRTRSTLAIPDARLDLSLAGRDPESGRLLPYSSFSVLGTLHHPDSRGTVAIRSNDPAAAPEIRFNFLASHDDRRRCAAIVRVVRQVMAMPALAPFVSQEIAPGAEITGEPELIDACRRIVRASQHAVGTCRMGMDATAVVDPRLRVRGIEGLRVIDGSIMPRIVAGGCAATIVVIAEKGCAMLREDARAH